ANGENCSSLTVGEVVTYTFVVHNTGSVTLGNVTVADKTFNGSGTISGLSTPVASSGSSATALLPGGTLTYTATYTVEQGDLNRGNISNQAEATGVFNNVSYKDLSGTALDNDSPTAIAICQNGSISLVKNHNLQGNSNCYELTAGSEVTYSFAVTNTGNVTLKDIILTDAMLDAAIVQNNNPLAPGETRNYTAVYVVKQTDVEAGFISNTATVTSKTLTDQDVSDVSGTDASNDNPTVISICRDGAIAIVKSHNLQGDGNCYGLEKGSTIVYTLHVSNVGNTSLTNVVVNDPLGAAVYQGGDNNSDGKLDINEVWTYQVEYVVTPVDIDNGQVVNQATVTAIDAANKRVSDVSGSTVSSNEPTVISICREAKIKLVKTHNLEKDGDCYGVNVGDIVTYTFTVTNEGNVTLSDINLVDAMLGLTGLTQDVSPLAAGNSRTYIATYKVTQADVDAGFIRNSAKVTAVDPAQKAVQDISGTNINNDEPTIIAICRDAGVSIVKSHNLQGTGDCHALQVGDKITYTFTVKNTGNVSLNDVSVTDLLPGIGTISSDEDGSLLPGKTRVFKATYSVTQADINRGSITNRAGVTAKTPEGNITGAVRGMVVADDEVIISICQTGKVAITKTVNKAEVSKVGEELTYTITVTNTGNIDLEEVTVEDVMLALNDVIDLKVGEVKNYQLKYTVTYNDLLKASIDNVASATLKTKEKVVDQTSTNVKFKPEIDIVKSADKSVITFLGELVEYTIEVTNTGTVDLVGVVVTDPMFPSFTGAAGNLAVGESKKFELTYESVLADIIRGEIRNTAHVEGTVGGAMKMRSFNPVTGVIEKLSNEVLVKVLFSNVLEVTKDADKTEINKEGEVITYTIKVANRGNYDLTDVVVKDPLTGMIESVGDLNVGKERTFTTTYAAQRSDFDKRTIVNEVVATAKDLIGGQVEARAQKTVNVAAMPFFIPNVFTPNDDGTNDTFEILGIEGFDRIEVTILNRWGNEVYRNSNYRNEWTGHGLNEGTYFYIVKTIKGAKEDLYKGHVLIKTR
ncbi:DUF7507 domain-containing protein, partial [Sphingobacterium faecale]